MGENKNLLLSDDVRKQNRLRVINQFRKSGVISRTEIGEHIDLSPGTVTNITTALLSDEVVRIAESSDDVETTSYGRPRISLELNPDYALVAAGSLTFNGIKLKFINYAGHTVAEAFEAYDLRGKGRQQIAQKIYDLVTSLNLEKSPDIYVFGVQGLTSKDGASINWSPILDQSGSKFNLELSKMSGARVIFANDSQMIARSLVAQMPQQEGAFAAVLMSYGIGMGLYVNGEPFHGINSSGLEFGHIPYKSKDGALCRCGNYGCVEAYASDYGIWRSARGASSNYLPNQQITHAELADIFDRAEKTNGPERKALEEAGSALGFALATMYALFDPFPVVFIGRASDGLSLMETHIRKSIEENSSLHSHEQITFTQKSDAMSHIEEGCAIIALNELDEKVAFQERRKSV